MSPHISPYLPAEVEREPDRADRADHARQQRREGESDADTRHADGVPAPGKGGVRAERVRGGGEAGPQREDGGDREGRGEEEQAQRTWPVGRGVGREEEQAERARLDEL